jgi:hypothetical protein
VSRHRYRARLWRVLRSPRAWAVMAGGGAIVFIVGQEVGGLWVSVTFFAVLFLGTVLISSLTGMHGPDEDDHG